MANPKWLFQKQSWLPPQKNLLISCEIKKKPHLLAVDEKTDTTQLFIFISRINTKFKITEELVRMCSIPSYTTRKVICDEVIKCLKYWNVIWRIWQQNVATCSLDPCPTLTSWSSPVWRVGCCVRVLAVVFPWMRLFLHILRRFWVAPCSRSHHWTSY